MLEMQLIMRPCVLGFSFAKDRVAGQYAHTDVVKTNKMKADVVSVRRRSQSTLNNTRTYS